MSAISTTTRTTRWKPAVAVTIVLGVLAFLSGPNAPLGVFWRPNPALPSPSAAQLPFFMLLSAAEAITFGLGIAFLFFGYPMVRAVHPAGTTLTRLAHLSIAWLLFSWWPHDSLHLHVGFNLGGLLAVEYAFHITLMIAGVILAYFFLTLVRQAGDEKSPGEWRSIG